MDNMDDLHCELFLNTLRSREELCREVLRWMNGKKDMFAIANKVMEVEVRNNPRLKNDDALTTSEACAAAAADPDFGCLYYPYTFEVDPMPGVDPIVYISNVRQLVEWLRRQGYDVGVTCQFEDQLVRRSQL